MPVIASFADRIDDSGRQFDKDGNLHQWWSDEDVEKFKIPAEQLAAFYDMSLQRIVSGFGDLCSACNYNLFFLGAKIIFFLDFSKFLA